MDDPGRVLAHEDDLTGKGEGTAKDQQISHVKGKTITDSQTAEPNSSQEGPPMASGDGRERSPTAASKGTKTTDSPVMKAAFEAVVYLRPTV